MSKVWPHIILASAGAMRWSAQADGVKALDSVPVLQAARPGAIRLFRHWFPQQALSADPRQVANQILRALGGYRHERLYVEACYNEIGRMLTAAHGEMIAEIVRVLHGEGLLCCGPSWSTGDYDAEHWQWMRDHGWCGLDAISVHCYWGNQGFTPWHALRYRQMWQPGDPPVLITECGRDRVEGGQGGWIRDGLTLAAYVTELRAYDAELQRDAYVLGAMMFTAGPTPDWEYFNADEVGDMIMSNHDPVVGEGFRKCEPFVGPWSEDEVYHANGTEQKTSLAIGARGYAVWRARTNRTIAVCDDGRVFADGGNEYAELRQLA